MEMNSVGNGNGNRNFFMRTGGTAAILLINKRDLDISL